MERLHQLFETYQKNYEEWDNLEQALMENKSKESWLEELEHITARKRELYQSNNEIIEELTSLYNSNDIQELADVVYEEALAMYRLINHDVRLFVDVCEYLIPYYESINDVKRLINLYGAAHFDLVESNKYSFQEEIIDMKYNIKSCSFLHDFMQHECNEQRRIIIAYFYYLVSGVDLGAVELADAIDTYYEFEEFIGREDVMKVIIDDSLMTDVLGSIREGILIGVFSFSNVDKETQRKFLDYARNYIKKYKANRKSDYELSAIEYASYLLTQYYDGIETKETSFNKFLDYFEYNFLKIENGEIIDDDRVVENINNVALLEIMAEEIGDEKQTERVIKVLLEFVDARWVKGNIKYINGINSVFSKVCLSFFKLKPVGIDKENSLIQLVIKRNRDVYLHGLIVFNIANAIYEEMIHVNPSYFDTIGSVPRSELRTFIYNASLIHDIGRTKIYGKEITERRKLKSDELENYASHVSFETRGIGDDVEIRKYARIMEAHHKYMGIGKNCGNHYAEFEDLDPIVELIAIAVAIDERTDPYTEIGTPVEDYTEVLIWLKKNAEGSAIDYMDLIQNSILLQDQIYEFVTEKRCETMYDVYHNWEKIVFSQDEESILSASIAELTRFLETHDSERFAPYLVKLQKLAKGASDEEIRGKALYHLGSYYIQTGNTLAAKRIATETTEILEKTGNDALQVRNMLNQGTIDVLNENIYDALEKYLIGASLASKNPEYKYYESSGYINIAYIYLKIHRYDKSLEYYAKAEEARGKDQSNAANILCGKGFCYAYLNMTDELMKCKEELIKHKEALETMPAFVTDLFFAVAEKSIGNHKEAKKYLNKAKSRELDNDQFAMFTVELHIFLDQFEEEGDYEEMAKQIDRFLEFAESTNTSRHIRNQFAQRRMHCAVLLKDEAAINTYNSYLYESGIRLDQEAAESLTQIEGQCLEGIKKGSLQQELAREKRILQENVKEAQNANQQKSAFLSSMSHEIRTPINAIIGLNEMILRECKDDNILQYSYDIENAGKQLLGIVNDVLDFSKIEAGKMEIVPQKYSLHGLIRDLKNMFETKIKQKSLGYKYSCEQSTPNVLYGDDLRIKQVLINLLSNAYKYTDKGSIELIVSYTKKDEKSIKLKCEVKDTGIGLKPEQIERLETPFERFDLIRNRSVQGTGLGMTIVVKILKQMGSELMVESEYGVGSSFSFEIEQEVLDWKSVEEEQKDTAVQVRKENEAVFHASKAKILVVDDNKVNLKVAQGLLKRTGAQITPAASGMECLEKSKAEGFHVILLDHMMPDIDGVETLHRLRREEGPNKDTPVIALTANAVNGAEEFYRKEGFDAFLSKPMNPVELEELLRKFLPEYVLD